MMLMWNDVDGTHAHAEHPLEPEIAQVYQTDRAKFDKNAKDWTKKYAK